MVLIHKENGLDWAFFDPRFSWSAIGFIPSFLHKADPRSAREQFDENYAHGGGWRPMSEWQLLPGWVHGLNMVHSIQYPGDEPIQALAQTILRQERINYYPGAWVAIIQPDGSFEVARMD